MTKIKVAIVGIGNCASSLVQGVEYYKNIDENSGFISGIINNRLNNYYIHDIEFVAAFDVNSTKVGKDLSDAIFIDPNCTSKFCSVPNLGVNVLKGPLFDGLDGYLKDLIPVDEKQKSVNVAEILKNSGAEILINYLPTGSKVATEFYAEQALLSNCAFINGIPEPIASSKKWQEKFSKNSLPLVGDDIKSQLGATPLHRALIDLFIKGGCRINNTYQINIGNNTDFINLSDSERVKSKTSGKTGALQNLVPYPTNINVEIRKDENSDPLVCQDAKKVYIHIEGENFGSRPISIDAELFVEDSPNGAGSMVDVIRSIKVALDHGDSGAINPICARYFKHPPVPLDDETSFHEFENYHRTYEGKWVY